MTRYDKQQDHTKNKNKKQKPTDKSDFAVIKNINMIHIFNEIDDKMKNFTKELEYINKT